MDTIKFSSCCTIINSWCVEPTKSEKGQHDYYKRVIFLSYDDFSRLCNVIVQFPEWGCTSGTGTSGTPWWYWKRETSLTHSAPCETCWCRVFTWMDLTIEQHSARRGRSGNDRVWGWRRKGWWPQGRLVPTGAPLRWYRPSNTWDSDIGGRWWLVGGDTKPGKGAEGLEENVKDPEQGGGKAVGVRIFV